MKYTKPILEKAVAATTSIAGVLRYLRVKQSGGMHGHIKRRIQSFRIDTTHFTGQGWNKGLPDPKRLSAKAILVKNRCAGARDHRDLIKRALDDCGVEEECDRCDCPGTWRGLKLKLEIHHKNGDFTDNRLKNLSYLCPNCHQQHELGLW